MKTALALGSVALLMALGLGAAAAPSDPWVGKWKSVDTDGSHQTLTITKRADAAYDVILFDDSATLCGGQAATGKGVGTVSGNFMTGTTVITCADGNVKGTFPFKGTYDPKTDTFTDGLGVVWSRVKSPPPPKKKPKPAKPLPLGRLVLTAADAPGLKPKAAQKDSAKKLLAAALQPRRLPAVRARSTQLSHFAKKQTGLWSIAFVMSTPNRAHAVVGKIAKAARGKRIDVGVAGYALGQRKAAVVWQRGRVVGAIVFQSGMRVERARIISSVYARVADARVADALSRTAFTSALGKISRKGQLSLTTALALFGAAYKPLPGTRRVAGTAEVREGTFAAQALLRYWGRLTAAQKTRAKQLMGVTGVSFRRGKATVRRAGRADIARTFGDPGFKIDTKLSIQAAVFNDNFASATALDYELQRPLVVGLTTADIGAAADTTIVNEAGVALPLSSPEGTFCRIRLGPEWKSSPAPEQPYLLAHEVFHCFQDELVPASKRLKGKGWVIEGTATWAGLWTAPAPAEIVDVPFSSYFRQCKEIPLFQRVYSAFGFFGHSEDVLGGMWTRMLGVLGQSDSDLGAFIQAGGPADQFINSWASSVVLRPNLGLFWTQASPIKPPPGYAGCEEMPVFEDVVVSAAAYTELPLLIPFAPPQRPLLHVRSKANHSRIAGDDGRLESTAADGWYCLNSTCECPPDTVGTPPPGPTLRLPGHLALTGGEKGSQAAIEFVSLESYCKLKQEPPRGPCPIESPRSVQRSAGCPAGGHSPPGPGEEFDPKEDPPEPVECFGHGCARSVADPHLSPFDSPWYDFQGVGEFTLVRSTTDDLEVQVRQQPWPGSKVVSQNVAVAMRVGSDRVGVYRGNPLVVRVNRRPVFLGKKDLRLPGGGTLKPLREGQLDVVWPDGSTVRVIPTGDLSTDVIVSLAASRQGKVKGLLGNDDANSNDADDFTTRGGRRLDQKAVRGTGKRAYNLLYHVFGESWRVSQKASLFDYAPGQSTRTFTDRRFPSRVATLEQIDARLRRKAEGICRRMRIQDKRVFRNCVLDVSSTGFFSFAVSASTAERSVKKARKAPKPAPPKTPGATVRWAGKTYVYRKQKNQPFDGCSTSTSQSGKVFEAQFSVPVTTKNKTDAFKLAVIGATKDGTYTKAGAVFGVNGVPIAIEQMQVTLAGKRTRGTFSGVDSTPAKQPVTGSFQC